MHNRDANSTILFLKMMHVGVKGFMLGLLQDFRHLLDKHAYVYIHINIALMVCIDKPICREDTTNNYFLLNEKGIPRTNGWWKYIQPRRTVSVCSMKVMRIEHPLHLNVAAIRGGPKQTGGLISCLSSILQLPFMGSAFAICNKMIKSKSNVEVKYSVLHADSIVLRAGNRNAQLQPIKGEVKSVGFPMFCVWTDIFVINTFHVRWPFPSWR